MLRPEEWQAAWLTLRLAALTAVLLLVAGAPLAWWLARTRSRWKPAFEAVVALPLVLPPTVLGFYLLLAFAPAGWLGGVWMRLTGHALAFTFEGLVLASMLYSLPFVVQPLQAALEALGREPLELAATLRAGPLDRLLRVALPLARRGLLSALVLGFAHTLGEFGVVLMVGGSIPGATRVLSIALFDRVESLDYASAHRIAAFLLGACFVVLLVVYGARRRDGVRA